MKTTSRRMIIYLTLAELLHRRRHGHWYCWSCDGYSGRTASRRGDRGRWSAVHGHLSGIAGTQRIGLAKPAAGLGTPININTIIVGGDTAARTAFQALADRTAGKLFAGDVVQAFLSAIALVVPPAPKIINLALNKPAVNYIPSNDQPARVASRVVDGNTNGDVWGNSVSSTHFQNQASWTVDLGSSRWIDDIKIWKRTDCCMIQMSDYYIFVSEQPFSANSVSSSLSQLGVTNIFRAGWSTAPADTFAIGRTGRYVRIQLKGANVLSLAEVQLMGAQ